MAIQIILLAFMITLSATLTQVTFADAGDQSNSTGSGVSDKNKDVFALLQLEKDVSIHEGSLKELHSGSKSPFDLLGEVKDAGKFTPESGSFLPEYDDTTKDNNWWKYLENKIKNGIWVKGKYNSMVFVTPIK